MRYLSWLLSFFLHAMAGLLLIQTIQMVPQDMESLLQIDLTEIQPPETIIQPAPKRPPSAPKPVPVCTAPPVSQPLSQDKTIVIDDTPQQRSKPAPLPASKPEPVPTSKAIPISPVKRAPSPETPLEADRKILVRKDDIIVHRGHEGRFGRSMMADYYSYSPKEFSGQFTTRDDRTISIIDARNTKYGRFLLYDSKHKTLRRLKEFGKYVYTIGPSAYADEPVTGTITFLAKDDRIERFIMTTDDDRLAYFPRKVHIREEEVHFPTNTGIRSGYASLPPDGKDHQGVIFIHGNRCVNQGFLQGFTRTLSSQGLASLSFMPRGCEDAEGKPASVAELISDTRAALSHFGDLAPVNFRRIGLWGNGPGVPIVIEAAHGGALTPAFMVCVLDDALAPSDLPSHNSLLALNMPVLWFVTGHHTARWQPSITALESLRDASSKRFTIVVAPTSQGEGTSNTGNSWIETVTEDHARLVISWIKALPQ